MGNGYKNRNNYRVLKGYNPMARYINYYNTMDRYVVDPCTHETAELAEMIIRKRKKNNEKRRWK